MDERTFITNNIPNIITLINNQNNTPIKVKFILTSKLHRTNPATGVVEESYSGFHSQMEEVYADTNVPGIVSEMTGLILEKVAKFQERGSGWQFDKVVALTYISTPLSQGLEIAIFPFQRS